MRQSTRISATLGGVLAGALALTACGGPAEPADTTLRLPVQGIPGTLNPALAFGHALRIGAFLYDPLVNLDPESGEVVSGIAESWELTDTGATFTIKEGVMCTDGHELTASDVARYFEYIQDPETNAPYITGYFSTGPYTVTADDATRTFTIDEGDDPYPFLLLGLSQVPVVCPGGLDDPDSLTNGAVGTGPYELVDVVPDVRYTLGLREGYTWGPGGATTDEPRLPRTIEMEVNADARALVNQLLTGEIDIMTATGAEYERVEGEAGFDHKTLNIMTEYFFFNQRPELVFGDPAVRKALAIAVDREVWGRTVMGDYFEVANSLITGLPQFCTDPATQAAVPTGTVDDAKRVLDEAGWTEGADGIRVKDGRRLEVNVAGVDAQRNALEYLQEAWTPLGVETTITIMDNAALNEAMYAGTGWDLRTIEVGTNVPGLWIALFDTDTSTFAGIDNPEYDSIYPRALKTPLPEGCEVWDEAGVAIMEAVNVYPLKTTTQFYLFREGIEFQYRDDYLIDPTSIRMPN